jgi:hypothetical protein
MTVEVRNTPVFLPDSTQSILQPSSADRSHACQFEHHNRKLNCDVPLYIGVFFDGTNNNRERDEPVRGHTNIVRLYNAHPAADAPEPILRRQGHYRIYVPGVGTRFDAGEEWRESMEGKSMAKGAQARVLFAVLEVINAVHKAFVDGHPLIQSEDIPPKLRDYVQRVEQGVQSPDGESPSQRESRRAWMRRLNAELAHQLAKRREERPRPHFPFVRINVFGFSRGAAQAQAFCHWINDVLAEGAIAGLKLEIGFVGLFDCVASVGLADSARRSLGFHFADGHLGWASEIRGELPAIARRTVHMIAAHEQRLNFPLSRVTGENVEEIIYPGVHSDVGGGYLPCAHGRAKTEDRLLSQIPLAHMHRQARRWDVPLVDWLQMDPRLQRDYTIHTDLIAHWNDYMLAADADWQLREGREAPRMGESGDFAALMRQHRRLYLSFRRRYAHEFSMQALLASLPLDGQDHEDITSYNKLLTGDLELLRARRKAIAEGAYLQALREPESATVPVWVSSTLRRTSNYLPQLLAGYATSGEDEGIDWALTQFEGEEVRGTGHMALLTHQVHDSLAGFYLIGYMTAEDKAEKLLAIVREGRARGEKSLKPYQREVFVNFNRASESDLELAKMIDRRLEGERQAGAKATTGQEKWQAEDKYKKDSIFTPEEQARAAKLFPRQTDADAATMPDGVENVARLITRTRREGGGYLLPRAIFEGNK